MANTYATLEMLKGPSALNITGSGDDARLLAMAEAASRLIDRHCNRHFYVSRATRRFDGNGGPRLLLPDLVRVDDGGVRTDDGREGTFGTTWDPRDYVLLPRNADPESSGGDSRPYTSIEVSGSGRRQAWPTGRGTVQITGEWGWQRRLRRRGETRGVVADAVAGEVRVSGEPGPSTLRQGSGRTDLGTAGHTLLIDEEQLYVREAGDGTLEVDRGVNGTEASEHDAGTPVYVFEYPGPVVEAALVQTVRLWRLANGGSEPEGRVVLDADVRALLGSYRKPALGMGA